MFKKKISKEEKEELKRKASFKERVPVKNIEDRLFVTKNNEYLSVFKLGQKAIDLMSDDEVYAFSRSIETAFETLDLLSAQFLLLPVPFDLAPYQSFKKDTYKKLKSKEEEIKDKIVKKNMGIEVSDYDGLSKELRQHRMFEKYIDDQLYFVTRNMQKGTIANKHSYVICKIRESYNKTAAKEAANNIEEVLRSVLEGSRRCSESEMEKILLELYNPLRPEIYINT